jgi:hypothetical protein
LSYSFRGGTLNESHPRRVLIEYVTFYNEARPHHGLNQLTPVPGEHRREQGAILRRDVLGGLLHDYYRLAA